MASALEINELLKKGQKVILTQRKTHLFMQQCEEYHIEVDANVKCKNGFCTIELHK